MDNKEKTIEQLKANLETLMKDDNAMKAIVEALSKPKKVNKPKEMQCELSEYNIVKKWSMFEFIFPFQFSQIVENCEKHIKHISYSQLKGVEPELFIKETTKFLDKSIIPNIVMMIPNRTVDDKFALPTLERNNYTISDESGNLYEPYRTIARPYKVTTYKNSSLSVDVDNHLFETLIQQSCIVAFTSFEDLKKYIVDTSDLNDEYYIFGNQSMCDKLKEDNNYKEIDITQFLNCASVGSIELEKDITVSVVNRPLLSDTDLFLFKKSNYDIDRIFIKKPEILLHIVNLIGIENTYTKIDTDTSELNVMSVYDLKVVNNTIKKIIIG